MKKLLLLVFTVLFITSCSKKDKIDPLVGKWIGGIGLTKDYTISVLKTDSSYLVNFIKVSKDSRYKVDQVLFKNIKKQSDSLYLGKGLYIKDIYRTETTWDNYYGAQQVQVFDHFEYLDVEYKMTIIGDTLKCTPFGEGLTWKWIRLTENTVIIDDDKLIQPKQLGKIKMASHADFKTNKLEIDKIGKTYREVVYGEEGDTSFKYKLMRNDTAIINFSLTRNEIGKETDIIGEIQIFSSIYRTEKNIGVGSVLSDFVKAYPTNNIWYTYISGMFVIETKELENIQFIIEDTGFIGDKKKLGNGGDMDVLSIKDFNPSSKIKSIRML